MSRSNPCLSCVSGRWWAQERVGALGLRRAGTEAGAVTSTQHAHEHAALNHRMAVVSGVLDQRARR